jgi:hypothetical protein
MLMPQCFAWSEGLLARKRAKFPSSPSPFKEVLESEDRGFSALAREERIIHCGTGKYPRAPIYILRAFCARVPCGTGAERALAGTWKCLHTKE